MDFDCLNELRNFFRCKRDSAFHWRNNNIFLNQYFGITQHPETKNYMMLKILYEVAMELLFNTRISIVQHDLHSGNIFISEGKPVVTDLGINKASSTNNAIYGVIPYIAPEVFKDILDGFRSKIPIDTPQH
ncbi:hypothetical protein C2G38_2180155 [Gigaspora rosea]|uniref:Protein kinase domain-containing protein n=1 Tax=Gigaspora rosea TaxID=44941 RepID=A0A397VFK5_9GLOM|nr:hypothetical protein C2G38_2180155 [Gigaspora rosea]